MTHSYEDPAGAMSRGKTERMLVRAFGVTLAVAGAVSLVHLVGQYRQAAPYREAQAAERVREREAREAEQARRDAETEAMGRLGSGEVPPPVAVSPASPSADLSREEVQRRLAEQAVASTSRREPVSAPLRWRIQPDWPSVRDDAFPSGVSRIGVEFRCRVSRDGVLSNCAAVENPVGTGLADRMRPALTRARMEPMMVDDRPVESSASFSISFSIRPRPPVAATKPPPEPDTPPLPPAEPPPPEPAPVG